MFLFGEKITKVLFCRLLEWFVAPWFQRYFTLLRTQKNRLNLHQYLFICLLVVVFFLDVYRFLLGGRLFCREIFLNRRGLMSGISLWDFLEHWEFVCFHGYRIYCVLGCDSSVKGSSLLEFNEAGLQFRKYELLQGSFQ